MEGAIGYVLAGLLLYSGTVECLVLHFTKTAKDAVVVFLTSKCIASISGGCLVLARCVCITKGVDSIVACGTILGCTFAGAFIYISHVLLAYIDLYLSLKRMTINDPPISKTKAILLSVLTWMTGYGIGALGFLFRNPDWQGDGMADCYRYELFHLPGYTIAIMCLVAALLIAIFALNRATTKVLQDSISNNELHSDNGEAGQAQNKAAKYIEDRKRVVKILAIMMWFMEICWGLVITICIVSQLCALCRDQVWINPVVIVLQTTPVIAAGWIYLFNNKGFREACGRLSCRRWITCK